MDVPTGAANIAPGSPVSFGSLILCLREPGTVTIERVELVEVAGGLVLGAFAVRPSPYVAGGEGGIGIRRDDLRAFGLDPSGPQIIDGTCPATDEDEAWADTSELVFQVSYPTSGSTPASAASIEVTYAYGGSGRSRLAIPFGVVVCESRCPPDA
jgi:hypothetical protein